MSREAQSSTSEPPNLSCWIWMIKSAEITFTYWWKALGCAQASDQTSRLQKNTLKKSTLNFKHLSPSLQGPAHSKHSFPADNREQNWECCRKTAESCTCEDDGWVCQHYLFALLCSDALACASLSASVCFQTVRQKTRAMSSFTQYKHSLSCEHESGGSKSEGFAVSVSALISKPSADLSRNADLSHILPTDMPVITTSFTTLPPPTPSRTESRHWDRWTVTWTRAHKFQIWLARER